MTQVNHTYDDNGAYAPNLPGAYIRSFLRNPSTGTIINSIYGYGTAYKYYRENPGVVLEGWWSNGASSGGAIYIQGTFHF